MNKLLCFTAVLLLIGCHDGGKSGSLAPVDPPVCECEPIVVGRGVMIIDHEVIEGIFVDQDCDPLTRPIFVPKVNHGHSR